VAISIKILLVEDNSGITKAIAEALTDPHYVVEVAEDGALGLAFAETGSFDLIVLDLHLITYSTPPITTKNPSVTTTSHHHQKPIRYHHPSHHHQKPIRYHHLPSPPTTHPLPPPPITTNNPSVTTTPHHHQQPIRYHHPSHHHQQPIRYHYPPFPVPRSLHLINLFGCLNVYKYKEAPPVLL